MPPGPGSHTGRGVGSCALLGDWPLPGVMRPEAPALPEAPLPLSRPFNLVNGHYPAVDQPRPALGRGSRRPPQARSVPTRKGLLPRALCPGDTPTCGLAGPPGGQLQVCAPTAPNPQETIQKHRGKGGRETACREVNCPSAGTSGRLPAAPRPLEWSSPPATRVATHQLLPRATVSLNMQ